MRREISAKSSADVDAASLGAQQKKFGPSAASVGRAAQLDLSESSSSEDEASAVVKPVPRPVVPKHPEKKAVEVKAKVELSDDEDDGEMALKLVTLV